MNIKNLGQTISIKPYMIVNWFSLLLSSPTSLLCCFYINKFNNKSLIK